MKSQRLLLHALIGTFAILATTFMLGDYGRAMVAAQQKTLLGGDIRIRSPEPFAPVLNAPNLTSFKQANWVTLNTMISANGNFVLVTMKAVDKSYPLYGEVRIDTGSGEPQQRRGAPPKDGIWLPKSLGQRLKIKLGDQVSLANQSYRVDAWLLETPDLIGGFQSFFPLVLVNFSSIDQTLLTKPGARPYFFRAYAVPNGATADQLISTIERLKDPLIQIQRTDGDNNRTSRIVDNVFQFISMFLTLGVAFAVLALSLASQDYALRAERQIALLKALGASRRRAVKRLIRTWPKFIGSALIFGLLIGILVAIATFLWLRHFIPMAPIEPAATMKLLSLSLLKSAAVGTIIFVVIITPFLWRTSRVPTWSILHAPGNQTPPGLTMSIGLAAAVVGGFIWLITKSAYLAGLWLGAVLLWGLVWAVIFHMLNTFLVKRTSPRSVAGIAFRRLHQTTWQTLLLSGIGGLVTTIFITVGALGTELAAEWKHALTDKMPNHFLLDVMPDDKPFIESFLHERGIRDFHFYPIIRARLAKVNGRPAAQRERQRIGALHRPLNLTYADVLPPDNVITDGDWATTNIDDRPAISIEASLAQRLGIKLGDMLTFAMGEKEFSGVVTTIRQVEWDNLRPNFFIIFRSKPQNIKADISYITAFHLPPNQADLQNLIAERWPTVLVLDLRAVVAKLNEILATGRTIVGTFILVVALMALLLLTIVNDLTEHIHARWTTMTRVFGASQRLITSIMLAQTIALSLNTGLLSLLFGWSAYLAIARTMFDLNGRLPSLMWLAAPILISTILALLLMVRLLPMAKKTTIQLLRER